MMHMSNFPQLVQSVQRNCHIADARHAREMTLCNYLLEMREFYRWEHEVPLARPFKRKLNGGGRRSPITRPVRTFQFELWLG